MTQYINNSSYYIFQFPSPIEANDIDKIEISKISGLNIYRNEKQHLVIIKKMGLQENISMNHTDIKLLLDKYGLSNYNNMLLSRSCCNS